MTNLKRICVEEDSVKHCSFLGSRDGAVVRALASYQCGLGSNPGGDACMWIVFVVDSLPCSGPFFPGTVGTTSCIPLKFPFIFFIYLVSNEHFHLRLMTLSTLLILAVRKTRIK